MASNQKQITDAMRAKWTNDFMSFVSGNFDTDVCQTAAGTFMFPVVDRGRRHRRLQPRAGVQAEAGSHAGAGAQARRGSCGKAREGCGESGKGRGNLTDFCQIFPR